MKLRILHSPAGHAANNQAILEIAKTASTLSDSAQQEWILTPENHTFMMEETFASALPNHAFLNVNITNFSRLFQKLYKKKTQVLSKESGVMLMRKILIEAEPKLISFKKSIRHSGFASEIYNTVLQLKSSRIMPEALASTQNLSPSLAGKVQDLSLIYSEYEKQKSNTFIDSADKLDFIQEMLEVRELFKNTNVWVMGFDAMNAQAKAILKAISKSANSINIVCSKNNESPEFSEMHSTAMDLANALNIQPKSEEFKESALCKNTELLKFGTKEEEINYITSQILKNIKQGKRFFDFSVCTASIENYSPTIRQIFSKHGIPFFIDEKQKISSVSIAKLICNFFNMLESNFALPQTLEFIKNPLSGLTLQDAWCFENFCLKYDFNFSQILKPYPYGKEDNNFEIAEKTRNKIVNLSSTFLVKNKLNAGEFVKFLRDFFEKADLIGKMPQYIEELKCHNPTLSKLAEVALEKTEEILQSFESVLGEVKLGVNELAQILTSGLESKEVSIIPPEVDMVSVTSLSQSALKDYNSIFIVGASEGDFPKVTQDTALLTDSELTEIDEKLKAKIEPHTKVLNAREKTKCTKLLHSAKSNLTISFAEKDESDQKRPGLLFNIFQGKMIKTKSPEATDLTFAKDQLFSLIQSAKFREALGSSRENMASLHHALKGKLSESINQKLENINIENQKLTLVSGKDLFFRGGKTSISEIENYFTCPFKHFIDYGLKVKMRDDAKMKAIDIGNLLHQVLELFCKELISKKITKMSDNDFSLLMKKILNQVMKNEKHKAEVNSFMLEALKNEVCRVCFSILSSLEKTRFMPVASEIRFGEGGELPPVRFKGTNITLEGKIDRIDAYQNFIRIIDYKTGQIDLNPSLIYHGSKTQLFAYLLAFENPQPFNVNFLQKVEKVSNPISSSSLVTGHSSLVAGVFYLPIKSTFSKENDKNILGSYKLQGWVCSNPEVILNMDTTLGFENPKSRLIPVSLSTSQDNKINNRMVIKQQAHILQDSDFEKLAKYVKELTVQAITEIQEGNISPSPLQNGQSLPCDYCPHKAACGVQNKDIRKAKEGITIQSFV